jgi:ubiquinone/menaquinone biosynthesis C-methylase UbiE
MRYRYVLLALGLILTLTVLSVGSALPKFDYGRIFSRAGWQIPDRVIQSLDIQPGDRVADIGAGDGYFTFRLADAAGPGGKVYAVEVDKESIETLRVKTKQRGYSNVEVILGELDDPLLPDGEIDLVFLCNAYHHIEERRAYFQRLRKDLTPQGRVAIIDMKVSPLVRLFVPTGHWTTVETMQQEMHEAKYHTEKQLEFLPAQNFLLFSVLQHSE